MVVMQGSKPWQTQMASVMQSCNACIYEGRALCSGKCAQSILPLKALTYDHKALLYVQHNLMHCLSAPKGGWQDCGTCMKPMRYLQTTGRYAYCHVSIVHVYTSQMASGATIISAHAACSLPVQAARQVSFHHEQFHSVCSSLLLLSHTRT